MTNDSFLRKQKLLQRYLKAGLGCRIGEASVCSRKVHTIDPYQPAVVSIITNADAGRVFYKRERLQEIVHIDIFHAVGYVQPQAVAFAVKRGLERYAREIRLYERAREVYQLAHYFDLQTGVGGGRVTGTQLFGQKESTKKAHLNHVHLSGKLPDIDLAAIFFIIAAVEQAVIKQGLELRRIEYLRHEQYEFQQRREELQNYTTFTDTFLREQPLLKDDQAYGHELVAIADIVENLDDLEELSGILKTISDSGRLPANSDFMDRQRSLHLENAWLKLIGYGLVIKVGNRYRLSEAGLELSRHLLKNARELEVELRQQSLALAQRGRNTIGSFSAVAGRETTSRKAARRTIVQKGGEFLAVNQTLANALQRRAVSTDKQWQVNPGDMRFEVRQARAGIDICLLLDASASMLGKRMKAAKNLAEHLAQNSQDRISVITFQEQSVDVVVPFTRNRLLIRKGLAAIKPGGLTPLAAGLRQATDYVQANSQRPGLLLLVTDGVPTLGEQHLDPLHDALAAAQYFKERTSFRLSCVGLQPNHDILRRVVEQAAGNLHVIDELNTASLVHIATSERSLAEQKI